MFGLLLIESSTRQIQLSSTAYLIVYVRSFMSSIQTMNIYQEAWRNIVRPTQIKSKMSAYGPRERLIDGRIVIRKDLTVLNRNQKKLEGFLFFSPQIESHETVLYLHGNGGSKLEAMPLVQLITKFGMNLAAFDLPGCGNSDPQTLSYGVNEVFDIKDMLQEVRRHVKVGRVVLWGRSMGSLCAIMFAEMYAYEVNALILDSPFRWLNKVVERIAARRVKLPMFILKPALYLIENRAAEEVGFNLFAIDYLSIFKKLNPHLPVLFIFSNFDSIVPAQEVLDFYNAYTGPKDLCEIYCTHDQDRSQDLFRQGMMWLTRTKKRSLQSAVKQARMQLHERRQEERLMEESRQNQCGKQCRNGQQRC